MNQRSVLFVGLLLAGAAVIGCGGGASSTPAPGNPAPSITLISPTSTAAGSGQFNLVLNGQGLSLASTVHFGANILRPFLPRPAPRATIARRS
jgi:hypothetical protein